MIAVSSKVQVKQGVNRHKKAQREKKQKENKKERKQKKNEPTEHKIYFRREKKEPQNTRP